MEKVKSTRRDFLKAAAVSTPVLATGIALPLKTVHASPTQTVVDLSYPIFSSMPVFPGMPVVEMDKIHTIIKDTFASKTYLLGTHTGTHTDAQCHFLEGEAGIEGINLNAYIGEAVLVKLDKQSKEYITVADLEPYADMIGEGSRVILDTKWGDKFKDQLSEIGADAEKATPFFTEGPRLSIEAAQWLADKGIIGVSMDMATPNPPDYIKVHEILLSKNIAITEAVANLDQVRHKDKIFISSVPLNIVGADGFPVRMVALI